MGHIFKGQTDSACPLKMGFIVCPETSIRNYQPPLRNIPEESRAHLDRGESLKSCIFKSSGMLRCVDRCVVSGVSEGLGAFTWGSTSSRSWNTFLHCVSEDMTYHVFCLSCVMFYCKSISPLQGLRDLLTEDWVPVGTRFSAPVQTSPGAHPASIQRIPGVFCGG
jgi:hypothetical protein